MVGQRHQHRLPEVLPGHARHARAGSRRCARSSTASSTRSRRGVARAATSSTTTRRRRSAPSCTTSSSPSGPPSTARCGSTSASRASPSRPSACFILSVDDTMDSILNWYREEGVIFKGGSGSGVNLSQDPLQRRAAQGRRHGIRPGQLHARRRRLGRHDQVGRQDPAGRQDGHPRRRPPRHRGVHLVQGQGGAQGARAARQRLRHGPRRVRLVLDPVPERQQLGPRHRRVHAGRRRGRRLGPHRRHHR